MDPATKVLSEFIHKAGPRTLPSPLYALAKRYVLDTIGATIFGATKPWSQMIMRYVRGLCASGGRSTVLGAEWLAAPALASLVNGSAAHAFELDDVHDGSLLHPGVAVVPAALAVAESESSSGTDFLTSVIVGYELIVRAGLGVGSVPHMMRGFHTTGTAGVFGSAAAAAKLLGHDAVTTANALGIAGSLAGGLMEFSQSGGMVKRLHAGRAAEGGVMAAYLAGDGFTGPNTVLEGKYGFCQAFSHAPEPERLLAGLGEKFMIEEITVKPYSCCSDLHGTIDCMKKLVAKHRITPDGIRKIIVDTYSKVIEQNALDGSTSIMAAQYSVPFTAAASLFYDLGDPRSYRDELLGDGRVKELSKKVELRLDRQFDADYARKMSTRVTVETKDGKSHTAQVINAKGHFQNPLSPAEVQSKFRMLAAETLGTNGADAVINLVDELERQQSLQPLSKLLRAVQHVEQAI
jgi:2-methylcitrate dehydratase PrpD